jgi:hypothetical protein
MRDGSQMDDRIHPIEVGGQTLKVRDVNLMIHGAVYLLPNLILDLITRAAVQDMDLVPMPQQPHHGGTTYQPNPPGHKYLHRLSLYIVVL